MCVFFLYTNNQLSEREPNKTISLTIGSKRIKDQGINLTKEVKDFYTENSKKWIKKLQTTQTNGKIYHA